MEELSLGKASIDRCTQKHGYWFDHTELQDVLVSSREGDGVNLGKVHTLPKNEINNYDLQGYSEEEDFSDMSWLEIALDIFFDS